MSKIISKSKNQFDIPEPVAAHAMQLGQRLRLARIRRGMTAALLAAKCGVSRNTIAAMELGRPGVAIGVWLTALWALGIDSSVGGVADPDADSHGKILEAARRPVRARETSLEASRYDF